MEVTDITGLASFCRWVQKTFFSIEKTSQAKTYQLFSASTAQLFNDFFLIQMSAWKCVVSLVYCIVAIASSINTIDGV